MKVSGTATLNARPDQVWAALNDPAVLVRTIPGCEQLETVGPDKYRMTVTAGVASIKGTYLGNVELADHQPPGAFTVKASGSGAPGMVQADVKVLLSENGDGTTLLTYDADAVVGGAVGGVGQRVLTGVAKKTAGEFFRAVDAHLTGAAPAPVPPGAQVPPTAQAIEGPAPAAGTAPTLFTRPAPAGGPPSPFDVRGQLPGAVVGAAIALLGVLLGWTIARRRE